MRFIDDDRIAAGQNLAETLVLEHEVREQQMVIDDHQIGRLRIAPRLCDEALLEVFTATAKAGVGGRGALAREDWKSGVTGKSVTVRVDLGGSRASKQRSHINKPECHRS